MLEVMACLDHAICRHEAMPTKAAANLNPISAGLKGCSTVALTRLDSVLLSPAHHLRSIEQNDVSNKKPSFNSAIV